MDDPAITTGLAVFEALRTYGGRPFGVAAHLERLRESAGWFGIECPDDGVFVAEMARVIDGAEGESAILLTLTGGGRRLVRRHPLDLSRVGAPVRLATVRWEPPVFLPGWVKHTSRAGWVIAARRAGVDEVLFVGADGAWMEANRSNLIVVRGGVVCTPPDDGRILRGVTRDAVLAAAREAGVPVRVEPVFPGPAEELYVVSTFKELAPIVELDGQSAPGGGPVGTSVREAFLDAVRAKS